MNERATHNKQARNKPLKCFMKQAQDPGSKEVSVNNEPEAREPFHSLARLKPPPAFPPSHFSEGTAEDTNNREGDRLTRFHGARDNTVSGRLQPRRPAAHSVARAQQGERSTCAGLPCGSDAGGQHSEEAPSE